MPRSGCSALHGVNPNKKKQTCGNTYTTRESIQHERETERDRETERQRETERDRETERQRELANKIISDML